MEVQQAIRQRHSVRAFLDKPVDRAQIEALLDLASCSPSGANSQPWRVAVVQGKAKARLQTRLIEAFETGAQTAKDYNYYPVEWYEPFKQRRVDCGQQLYEAMGIERADRAARLAQWARNYRAFDAPVMLIFTLHRSLQTGSYMDTAMYMQTLMLAAVDQGLGTCAQAALGEYPDIVRAELALGDVVVVCGMALGYPDTSHPVNHYRTPRDPVASFTDWFE